jgi:SAM-dependent methyltransferase
MNGAAHPSVVLGPYLEPLARGRRVAILGDATLGLAERLAERSARLVHAYDPDATRTAEALAHRRVGDSHRQVSHAVFEADLGVRDGAFDLVVIPDLTAFADAEEVMRRARRLVPPSGVVIVVSPNPDVEPRLLGTERGRLPLGYYELYDLVALKFEVVRMVGQAPFVGYSVVDFAPDEEPEVAVDTTLLESTEEPEFFVAIASDRPVDLEPYALVQIPATALGGSPARGAADRDARIALASAEARIAALASELELSQERQRSEARDTQERSTHTSALSARVVELEQEVMHRAERLRDIESRAGDAHVRAERLTHELRDMDEELRRQRDRATRLSKQLDDERKARTKAELELAMVRAKLEAPPSEGARAEVAGARAEPSLEPRVPPLAEREAEHALREARRHAEEAAERAAQAERREREAAQARDAAKKRVEEVEITLERMTRERADAKAACDRLEQRCADLAATQDDSGYAAEVAALEASLLERAQVIAQMTRDLRESERIGRELVGELDALRAVAGPNGGPSAGDEGELPLLRRLDTLADAAAKAEADLMAATWRVAQLERELDAARAYAAEPSRAERELESALTLARQELATLRGPRGAGASDPPPAVAEQSVLLHQVASGVP